MVSKRSRRSEKAKEPTFKPAMAAKPAAAGLGAALAGVAVWAGMSLATKGEAGWMAILVGALAGLGVRYTAAALPGVIPGGIAAAIAVVAAVIGKILVASLVSGPAASGSGDIVTEDMMMQSLAVDIVNDRTAKNKKVAWPSGMSLKSASMPSDFPKDVWQEAQKAFETMGPAEKDALKKKEEAKVAEMMQAIQGALQKDDSKGGKSTFGLFDILFIGLGALAAFGLATRMSFRKAEDEE